MKVEAKEIIDILHRKMEKVLKAIEDYEEDNVIQIKRIIKI